MNTFRSEIDLLIKKTVPAQELARDTEITLRYFGWDGQGGASMQAVGEKYRLTRERVRQVTSKMVSQMKDEALNTLTTLRPMIQIIGNMVPASANRIESVLKDHGLAGDRLEGVLNAAKQFGIDCDFIKVTQEFGARFIIFKEMDGLPGKIMGKAQKLIGNKGYVNIRELRDLLPEIPETLALDFIRDVLSARDDVAWLDERREWVWLKEAPRNRLITCLSKMLTVFSVTNIDNIREGVNRYYRKGVKPDQEAIQLDDDPTILIALLNSWDQVTCSAAGIVRKTELFKPTIEPLDMEQAIALYILNKPEKMAREKEIENAMAPEVDGQTHPKKYNFSIALNYSPLLKKGDHRGEYVATGSL